MTTIQYLKQVGQNIRKSRKEQYLTQEQLAALCGIEKANLSRIECGKTNATILTYRNIAKQLDVELSELVK